ncbi:MAG TPA: ABC transporter [Rhodospirillaceae bacterium]|nr:MAG: ABC transporter [Alphaproteobacteria bacterium GWF2_58_20]HAU29680.1 ABC transporter [Rhodospirillaceae bacterium]
MSEVLRMEKLVRTYRQGDVLLEVLRGVDFSLSEGEIVALVGPSGCGKSTLLHSAGLLERPTAGEVFINGRPTMALGDRARTSIRRRQVGFVYQFHHLLPEFSALENVTMPLLVEGISPRKARARAEAMLDRVGLTHRLSHRPGKLSGGEQQRVAIARALVPEPEILLADEPTGNLDVHTSEDVFSLLLGLARETGLAALIATHNPDLAARMDRVVHLEEGCLAAR